MMFDPLEMTRRDPLEETVPDPPLPRIGAGRRRAMEAAALAVLAPALLAVGWVDHRHQAAAYEPREAVTLVARGMSGTLGHVQLRLAGRDATAATTSSTGAARLSLVVEVKPLDAQGVKAAQYIAYTVRDRAGHTWSAFGVPPAGQAAGRTFQLKVMATLPPRLLNSVVLEARGGTLARTSAKAPAQVLRFAH